MNKKLAFIDITFENLDSIKIPASYVDGCYLRNLSTSIECNGSTVSRHVQANYLVLRLKQSVDAVATDFDGLAFSVLEGDEKLSKRLKRCDITHVALVYDDGGKEEFLVSWNDSDGNTYRNNNQKVYVDKYGSVCVSIIRRSKKR